jgi:hypothetical protein
MRFGTLNVNPMTNRLSRMKVAASIFLALTASVVLFAQAPLSSTPWATTSQSLTPKDVRIYPYWREEGTKKITATIGFPDELRVVTTTNKIHLSGKKKVNNDSKGGGRPILHVGKLALIAPGDRKGKLMVKSPSAQDATYYYAALELDGDQLESKMVDLKVGKDYDWSATSQDGQTTLRISDAGAEVVTLTAPTEKVKGIGFASTVRWKDNEADLTITIN